MDRYSELEDLRRSLAMLPPGAPALDREAAMGLLVELQSKQGQRRSPDGSGREVANAPGVGVIETLTFRCAEGVDESAFLAADRRVQTEFVPNLPGFLRRTTARRLDGEGWIVVTLWEGPSDAAEAASLAAADPAVQALESLIEPGSVLVGRFETLE